MKMIKCDRCNEINETGDMLIIYENSTVNSDKVLELDLCKKCKEEVYKFIQTKD